MMAKFVRILSGDYTVPAWNGKGQVRVNIEREAGRWRIYQRISGRRYLIDDRYRRHVLEQVGRAIVSDRRKSRLEWNQTLVGIARELERGELQAESLHASVLGELREKGLWQ
jgi:hypothetical protein